MLAVCSVLMPTAAYTGLGELPGKGSLVEPSTRTTRESSRGASARKSGVEGWVGGKK
jgi:hypothetical protein